MKKKTENKFTVPFVPTQMPIIEIHIYAIVILKNKKKSQIRTISTPADTNVAGDWICDQHNAMQMPVLSVSKYLCSNQ